MEQNGRQPQELEFIMDGITTRMQIAMNNLADTNKNALEKMAESNRMMKTSLRWVCITALIVVIVVAAFSIVTNQIWIGHVNNLRQEMAAGEVVVPGEAVP